MGEVDHRLAGTIAAAHSAADVPLVIGGEEIRDDRQRRDSLDPSRPGVVVARYRQATEADIDRAVDAARERCRRLAATLASPSASQRSIEWPTNLPPPAAI